VQFAQAGGSLFDLLRGQTGVAINGNFGGIAGCLDINFQHLIGVIFDKVSLTGEPFGK